MIYIALFIGIVGLFYGVGRFALWLERRRWCKNMGGHF